MTLESTVLVVRGVMTHAEKTLAEYANDDVVIRMRPPIQKTIEADCTNAVGRLTGREVIAFVSGNDTAPVSPPDSSSSTACCIAPRPPFAPPARTTRTSDGCSVEGQKLLDATVGRQTRTHSPVSPWRADAGSLSRVPLAAGGESCS
jgi:hypothetical protein